jgi:hypothetical protein
MWRGPFNPEEFSIERVNQELQRKFHRARKTVHLRSTTAPPRLSPKRDRMQPVTLSTLVFPQTHRVAIRPNETVPLELNQRERQPTFTLAPSTPLKQTYLCDLCARKSRSF